MPLKNRYARRSKLSERKFMELLTLFAKEYDASHIAEALDVSRNTVNAYLRKIRMRLTEHALQTFPLFHDVQSGESIFHILDVRRRRRDVAAASILVGILRADRSLFIEVQPGRDRDAYRMFLRGRVFVEGTTNLDYWRDFGGRIDLDFDGDEGEGEDGLDLAAEQACLQPQMATVHGFISFARERLMKFRGVKEDSIRLHLKECEFRFNMHKPGVYPVIRRLLLETPLD